MVLHGLCRVNVAQRASVGRYLIASEPVAAGDVLLVEEPLFVSALAGDLDRLAGKLFTAMSNPSALPLVTQLFISILAEMMEGSESKSTILSQLSQLRGHPEQWRQTVGQFQSSLIEEFASKVKHDELLDLFAKLAANAHETDDKRAAVFALGSLAEHSCRPSAFKRVQHGQGHLLVIRALTDLEKGDAVSLAYVPEYYPTWHRQELLKRSFNFHCGCPRCAGDEVEVASAFVCPECDSPCCPPRPCRSRGDFQVLQCEECEYRVEDEEHLEVFREAERCERLCEGCTPYLHPYHYKIFHMYLGNLQLVSEQQRLEILEQLEAAHERLGCSEGLHPLHAKFAELAARSCQALGDQTTAAEKWQRAEALYASTHGADSEECLRCRRLQG